MKDIGLLEENFLDIMYDIDTLEFSLDCYENNFTKEDKEFKYIINSIRIQLKEIKKKADIIAAKIEG